MIEALYVVLTNAAPGRDADFNDWYTNVHARDTMRMRGGLAQQRFRLAGEQVQDFAEPFPAQYLALYEVYDAVWFAREHRDRALTRWMVIEDSLCMQRLDDFAYYPLAFRDKAPRAKDCSVVMEQMQVAPGQEAAFREWFADEYMPARIRTGGIASGALLAYEDYGQMMPFAPAHDHVAVWRLADDAARSAWRAHNPLATSPLLEADKTVISCWDVASRRIIKDEVTYPDAASLAREEAAQARIAAQGSAITDGKQRIK